MRSRQRVVAVTLVMGLLGVLQAIMASPALAGTDLTFVRSFGQSTGGSNNLGHPDDVSIDKDGNIFVLEDTKNRIQKYDENGNYLMTIGSGPGSDPGQMYNPRAMDLDDDGSFLYVADPGNKRVDVFDAHSGSFVQSFGHEGSGDGEFAEPTGVDWYNGKVYVADGRNHRVAIFTDSGVFQKNFGSEGSTDGKFAVPVGIAVGDAGIFVADWYWSTLQQFSLDGTFVRKLASHGTGEGNLNQPQQMALCQFSDSLGTSTTLYIVDQNDLEVERYFLGSVSGSGGFLSPFTGNSSPGTTFNFPEGAGCIEDGTRSEVLVADSNNGLVDVFDELGQVKVKVVPNDSPERLKRHEALTFEISQNGMTRTCALTNAKGSVTIPQADDIGLADDTYTVKGPPAEVKPKKVLNYDIPILPAPMRAFDKAIKKNKALKVELNFNFDCEPDPVRVRYTIK